MEKAQAKKFKIHFKNRQTNERLKKLSKAQSFRQQD